MTTHELEVGLCGGVIGSAIGLVIVAVAAAIFQLARWLGRLADGK